MKFDFLKKLLPRIHKPVDDDINFPEKKQKSNLSNGEEPKPRRINKVVLFVLLAFIAIAFGYTFQKTFDEKDVSKNQKTDNKKTVETIKPAGLYESLPSNYEQQKNSSTNPTDALNPGTPRLPTNANLIPPTPPPIPTYEQTTINAAATQRINEIRRMEEELETAIRSKIGVLNNSSNLVATGQTTSQQQPQIGNQEQPFPDQNRQNEKSSFLTNSKLPNLMNAQVIIPQLSEYTISAGSNIPCALISGINTDLPGSITAQVTENIYDTATGRYLLIPQGSRLIGKYDSVVTFGQYRVLLVWQRLMLPNGKSILLENMQGMDTQGYAGIRDGVDKHTPDLVRGVVLSALLSATTMAATNNHDNKNDYKSSAGQGAAQAVLDTGSQITRKNLERQPTLTVKPGTLFMVMVHQDLILEPFQ